MANRVVAIIEENITELNARRRTMETTLNTALKTGDKQLEKYARHFLEVAYDRQLKDYKETQARFK